MEDPDSKTVLIKFKQLCQLFTKVEADKKCLLEDLNGAVGVIESLRGQRKVLQSENKQLNALVTRLQAEKAEAQSTLHQSLIENRQLLRERAALESKIRSQLMADQAQHSAREAHDHSNKDSTIDSSKSSSIDYTSTDASIISGLGLTTPEFNRRRHELGSIDLPRKSMRSLKASSAARPPIPRGRSGLREQSGTVVRRAHLAQPEDDSIDEEEQEEDRRRAANAARTPPAVSARRTGDDSGRQRVRARVSRRSSSVPVRSPHRRMTASSRPSMVHATSDERLNVAVTEEDEDEEREPELARDSSADEDAYGNMDARHLAERASADSASDVISVASSALLPNTPLLYARPHAYVEKRIMTRDICDVCGNGLRFGATARKCGECRQLAHVKCASSASADQLPCMPRPSCKKAAASGNRSKMALSEWCSQTATPMVPSIVIACILTIEKYHMETVGLYRVTGTLSHVHCALQDMKNSRAHNIRHEPPEVITSCLKKFLRELTKPVIPASSFREMAEVLKNKKYSVEDKVIEYERIIEEMSRPHRDTLALVARHLQRVASVKENKMPLDNLVKVFAPTLADNSRVDLMNEQTAVLWDLLSKVRPEFFDQFARCGVLLPSSAIHTGGTIKRQERALETPKPGASNLQYSVSGVTPHRSVRAQKAPKRRANALQMSDDDNGERPDRMQRTVPPRRWK